MLRSALLVLGALVGSALYDVRHNFVRYGQAEMESPVSRRSTWGMLLLLLSAGIFLYVRDHYETQHGTHSPGADDASKFEGTGFTPYVGTRRVLRESPTPSTAPVRHMPVQGRVIDAVSGVGIADVRVHLIQYPRAVERVHSSTNLNGEFSVDVPVFDDASKNAWMVIPQHSQYFASIWYETDHTQSDRPHASNNNSFGHLVLDAAAERTEPLVVRMEPGQLLHGIVLDPDGKPISGARIETTEFPPSGSSMTRVAKRHWLHMFPEVQTDHRGRFAVSRLPLERASIHVSATHDHWVARWQGPIDPDQHEEIEITMVRPASLEIHVKGAKGSAFNATARSAGRWNTTSSQRRTSVASPIVIKGLPPGSADVTLSSDDDRDRESSVEVSDLKPGELRRVEIEVTRAHVVRGTLVDSNGFHLNDEILELRPPKRERAIDSSRTWDSGEFRFRNVETPGPFELWLVTGDRSERLRSHVFADGKRIEVVSSQTPFETLKIQALDERGAVFRRAHVSVESLDDASCDVERVGGESLLGEHAFRVSGKAPVVVKISPPRESGAASSPYFHKCVYLSRIPREVVEIQLTKYPELVGQVVDERGQAIVGAKLTLKNGDVVSIDSHGCFRHPLENHEKRGSRDNYFVRAKLVVPANFRPDRERSHLSSRSFNRILVYRHGREIRGGLLDVDGRPIALKSVRIDARWGSMHEGIAVGKFATAHTNDGGRFRFAAMPAGLVQVILSKNELAEHGYVSKSAFLNAGDEETNFVLRKGSRLSGRLTGLPLTDVDLRRMRVFTTLAGVQYYAKLERKHGLITYRFDGLPPASYDIVAVADEPLFIGVRRGVRAPSEGVEIRVRVPTGTIVGTVDVSLIPIHTNVRVRAYSEDGLALGHSTTYDLREFRLEQLRTDVTYTLVAQPSMSSFDGGEAVAMKRGVRAGDTVHLVPVVGSYVEGRVVSAAAHIDYIKAANGSAEFEAYIDESTGGFWIGPLPPGTYSIIAENSDLGVVKRIDGVTPGTDEVLLIER